MKKFIVAIVIVILLVMMPKIDVQAESGCGCYQCQYIKTETYRTSYTHFHVDTIKSEKHTKL